MAVNSLPLTQTLSAPGHNFGSSKGEKSVRINVEDNTVSKRQLKYMTNKGVLSPLCEEPVSYYSFVTILFLTETRQRILRTDL